MSPAIRSSRLLPSRMSQTAFVIGISTPTRWERSRSTGAVVRPSTVPICGRGVLRRGAPGDQLAGPPVAPEVRPAGGDQVADAREPRERLAAAAARLAEPRHLGEPARDDPALRVVAEPEPVDAAGGERDHVLRRRGELDADEVAVHVDAEDRAS